MLSQVYKAKRELFARMYPTTLTFKDGSTITIRFPEPRQVVKMPVTFDECATKADKTAWQLRRRQIKEEKVDTDKDDVKFDATKYIRLRKTSNKPKAVI